jgi:Acyl-CoA thioesterase C-terminal domain/Acyl-CoA thioesterase N-terminal domain
VSDCFYVADGDHYLSSELTRGPWDPDFQHAGPPAALLGRAMEGLEDADEFQIARITYEILRAVPIAPLRTEAEVVRPGRRVQMLEASLHDDEGEVMRARAWRLRRDSVELPELPQLPPDPGPPGPESAQPGGFPDTGQKVGYHSAMEYRFLEGAFTEPGPARVWMRMRQPLVGDEQPTPLQRVLTAADSGNGVSVILDWNRFLFINVDLTVQIERPLEGEWVCLDAVTRPHRNGVGAADTVVWDQEGRVGRALQTLLISSRD